MRRQLFGYPGSKFKLAPKYEHLYPPDILQKKWVSVFGGTASEMYCKPPSNLEIYNDINENLLAVFECLTCPRKTRQLRRKLDFNPISRSWFGWACSVLDGKRATVVDRAYALIGRYRQGYQGQYKAKWWCGDRVVRQTTAASELGPVLDRWHERFKNVRLECADWSVILDRYDGIDTFFFVDPPYLLTHTTMYRDGLSLEDHHALLDRLQTLKGKVFLCGYGHPDYLRRLRKWHRTDFRKAIMINNSGRQVIECVWTNYEPPNHSELVA